MTRDIEGATLSMGHRWVTLGLLAAMSAAPVSGAPVPASIRECRSVVDVLQRVRCYDTAVDAANALITSPDTSMLPAPVTRVPPPAAGAVTATGPTVSVSPPVIPVPPPVAASAAPGPAAAPPAPMSPTPTPQPTELFHATVAALSFRASGAANVMLENGQTWTQYGPEGRVPLKVGDAVTLRPGLFGAFVLVAPSGWITKVHLLTARGGS